MALRTDYVDATESTGNHPDAHNDTNTKVNDLDVAVTANTAAVGTLDGRLDVVEPAVAANTSGLATLNTAVGRLPKGQLAQITTPGGTVTSAASLAMSSSPITLAGRLIRVSVSAGLTASAAGFVSYDLAAPGDVTIRKTPPNIATVANRIYEVTFGFVGTADGIVTITFLTTGAPTFTVIGGTTFAWVDDMGAV